MNLMRYADIAYDDIANGTGFGATIFMQGCPHHCAGCHNPSTWDFNGGHIFDDEAFNELIEYYNKRPSATRLSISGGEPLTSQNNNCNNAIAICGFFKLSKPDIKIWLWTGYKFEDFTQEQKVILSCIDVLIDGPFIRSEKDLTLPFRGSRNQRVIDVKKTLENGHIVLWQNN